MTPQPSEHVLDASIANHARRENVLVRVPSAFNVRNALMQPFYFSNRGTRCSRLAVAYHGLAHRLRFWARPSPALSYGLALVVGRITGLPTVYGFGPALLRFAPLGSPFEMLHVVNRGKGKGKGAHLAKGRRS